MSNHLQSIFLLFLFTALQLSSCKVGETTSGESHTCSHNHSENDHHHTDTAMSVNVSYTQSKIAFLSYSIRKTESEPFCELSLQKKIVKDGKIKTNAHKHDHHKDDVIVYSLCNQNGVVIVEDYISNPLKEVYEYVNENGQLAKKEIILDSTVFVLRLPLPDNAAYIKLGIQSPSDKTTSTLLKHQL